MNTPMHSDEYVASLQSKVMRLEAQNAKLVSELENIANAQPHLLGELRNDFEPWAKSRARFAIAQVKGEQK